MSYIPPLPPRRFDPRAPAPTLHPRKVRGGVKLDNREGLLNLGWAGQRWMRLAEDNAPGHNHAEGLVYAKLGQTRFLQIAPSGGLISARVQGRLPQAYVTEIRLPTLSHEQWEQALGSMAQEARHLASLLGGEVPPGIEDLFAPMHLRLFPQDQSDLALSCTCSRANAMAMPYRPPGSTFVPVGGAGAPGTVDAAAADSADVGDDGSETDGEPASASASTTPAASPANPATTGTPDPSAGKSSAPATPWCKHICCVMALVAERLSRDPFLIFALRGLAREDLLERLRQRRALLAARGTAGGADRPVAAYSPRIPGVGDSIAPPLEHSIADFWQERPELAALDMPMQAPDVSHVLLRRLGSSPFDQARFPLVGLLATCYEVIGQSVRKETEESLTAGASEGADDAESAGIEDDEPA